MAAENNQESIVSHLNADTDSSSVAIHHTLGPLPFQASPGSHVHDGKDSHKIDYNSLLNLPDIGGGAAEYTSTVKHEVKLAAAISKGQAVYVSSADGTNMIVSKASNASEATSSKTMGLLESGGATNAKVNVITEGLLAGLDTSAATAGDPVWLGTDGNLLYGLASKPVAPAHLVFIGIVTRSNSSNGEIFVRPQNGFELNEIHDVLISSPAAGEVIQRTSSNLWENKTLAEAGIAAADHNHTGVYAPATHTHDDRYYTETETNDLLSGKSNTGHTHDDRYYTELQVDDLLAGKSDTNHNHDGVYLKLSDTATQNLSGDIDMNNNDIVGVNSIRLEDNGPNEGYLFPAAGSTASGWKIVETDSTLTDNNLPRDIQFVAGSTPARKVTITTAGNVEATGTVSGTQLISTTTTPGQPPLTVASSTLVTNLNADKLDGQDASAFAAASHDHDSRYYTETEVNNLLDGKQNNSGLTADRVLTTNATGDVTLTSVLPIGRIPTGTGSTQVALGNHLHTGVYAPATHDHDDRYYTESEVDTKLNGKLSTTGLTTSSVPHTDATGALTFSSQLPIGRIPTGTSSSTVALGDHNHDGRYIGVSATDIPSGADLNTYTTAGIYVQSANADTLAATGAANYPVELAGVLEVYTRSSGHVWQRYTTFGANNKIYHRTRYENPSTVFTWYPWKTVSSGGDDTATSLSIDSGYTLTGGNPGATANGAINIEGHLKFFTNTDAPTETSGGISYGDYDADIWMKDNGYLMAEQAIHLRPTNTGSFGSYTEQGRVVFKSKVLPTSGAVNLIQSGRNYSGTTKNDLAITEYMPDGTLDNTYWAYFDESTGGKLGLGINGDGSNAPAVDYRLHVKDNVGTTTPVARVENTGSAYSLIDLKGASTTSAVQIGANANALIGRIGTSEVLTVNSSGATVAGAISGTQLTSTITTPGQAPLVVASTVNVPNLNADMLDGQHASAFALSSHTHTIANVTGLQTALDAKAASAGYTASRVLVTDVDGTLTTSGTIDTTELGYLNGVTSGIQSQLNAKAVPDLYRFETADNLVMSSVGAQTTASVFGTNGVAVEAGTAYLVEGVIYFTAGVVGTSATHSISWGSPSGAATVTRNMWLWDYNSSTTALATAAAMSGVRRSGTTSFAALNTITMTGTHLFRGQFYGIVEFNAAGNFTPRITVTPTSATVDLTINGGSYIKLQKLGTTNTNGTWS